MAKRRLAGTEAQHAAELTRSRAALRSYVKMMATDLDRGDCANADRARKQALMFFGAAAAHFDAFMPLLGRGTFTDDELSEVDRRFTARCLLKKSRR
jgi:hypothetical protein